MHVFTTGFIADPTLADCFRKHSNGKQLVSAMAAQKHGIGAIGYNRTRAAQALGISASTFDTWVSQGLLPKGTKINGLRMWGARELEAAFEDLLEIRADTEPGGNGHENEEAFADFKG